MRACWYKTSAALYQQLLGNELGIHPIVERQVALQQLRAGHPRA
jgi:hypothetical protein